MSLLPRSNADFGTKTYWNSFFKKRGKKAFEWYGEYLELSSILGKYIKTKDNILMVGCGNSKLSNDLFTVGYRKMTNIDLSEVVIEQMQKAFPNQKWVREDATKTSFPEQSFSVVLDKGTLDALSNNDSEEIKELVTQYFSEVKRLLKQGGRFVCISLLQEHILSQLLEFFPENDFMFRVVRCLEAEIKTAENNEDGSSMPVFMVVATKFLKLPMKILEVVLNGDTIERLSSKQDIFSAILDAQRASIIRNGLVRNTEIKEEITFNLFRANEKNPRYSLFILDMKPPVKVAGRYAAFICPLGRETEWLFSTPSGRKKLLESSKHARLAIITMNRNHQFNNLEKVTEELNDCIKSFSPPGLMGQKIPFLTLGSDIGQRKILHEGVSEMSGGFVVEEILVDDQTFRRLIFLNNQAVVQSEAVMRSIRIKNKPQMVVDYGYLACQHHLLMVIGILASSKIVNNRNSLIVGLGGGGLCNFINRYLKEIQLTVVEIDPEVFKIAKQYFGLMDSTRLKVEINDGIEYLKKESANNKHYQSVLFDVDNKDYSLGLGCPPKIFLSEEIIDAVKTLIGVDGLFVLNLVCRDELLRDSVLQDLKKSFGTIYSYKLEEELNEILYCQTSSTLNETLIEKAVMQFLDISKHNKLKNDLELTEFMESLKKC